jgi:hypothetical protein
MERKGKWRVVGAGVALVIVSVLVIRAGLQPCAWLDIALSRSDCLCTLEEHTSPVDSVAFSPDGALLASGSRDNTVRLWHVADRSLLRVFRIPVSSSGAGGYSQDVAFSPANDTQVYVMRVAAGQYIEVDATVGAMGRGLRFSIDGADGVVVKAMGDAHVRTVVPSTQDYYVELVSDVGAVSYRMSVLIPVRIRFAPGATSAEVAGRLAANGVRHYVLRAIAGRRMIVDPHTTYGQVGLVISGADGQVLLSGRVGRPGGVYDGIFPTTQDYLIGVRAEGGTSADYTLEITIPPL